MRSRFLWNTDNVPLDVIQSFLEWCGLDPEDKLPVMEKERFTYDSGLLIMEDKESFIEIAMDDSCAVAIGSDGKTYIYFGKHGSRNITIKD